MSRFSYSAVLDSGQRVRGTLRCTDRHQAARLLVSKGCHPLEISASQAGAWTVAGLRQRLSDRVGSGQLAVFTRQLASLLKAGLAVVPALAALKRQSENRRLVQIIEELQESLATEGGQLSDALDDHPRVFSPVYRSLVRSGEESGNLVEVLQDLAAYLSRSARLRGQVIGAFIYPTFLLLLGTAAVFVLMTFVIPRFADLFRSFGRDLPAPTRCLIVVSGFFSHWWPAVLAALAGGCLAAAVALRQPIIRKKADWFLLHLPVLGGMCLKIEIARLARTLGALLTGGVRILAAIRITGQTAGNLTIRDSFTAIREAVATGKPLASALADHACYPALLINLVRTGEETGQLPEMLAELSALYEEEAERAISGAVKLLEPILIVGMGIVIASIVAAVMLPVFQANAMIQ